MTFSIYIEQQHNTDTARPSKYEHVVYEFTVRENVGIVYRYMNVFLCKPPNIHTSHIYTTYTHTNRTRRWIQFTYKCVLPTTRRSHRIRPNLLWIERKNKRQYWIRNIKKNREHLLQISIKKMKPFIASHPPSVFFIISVVYFIVLDDGGHVSTRIVHIYVTVVEKSKQGQYSIQYEWNDARGTHKK